MRRARNRTSGPAFRVSVIDRRPGGIESISLTVYPGSASLRSVIEVIQSALQERWRTTSVTDARHKPRY